MSQTTLSPAVTITTVSVNVTTPSMPSTTGPSCSALNTSMCAPCVPGTYYDNGAGFSSSEVFLCTTKICCIFLQRGLFLLIYTLSLFRNSAVFMLSKPRAVCVFSSLSSLHTGLLSASGRTAGVFTLPFGVLQQVRGKTFNFVIANWKSFLQYFVFSLTGSSACRACPPGAYSNNTGSISCGACTPGKIILLS